jgi:hypothetical protein
VKVDRDTSMGMLEEVKRLCETIWPHHLLKVIALVDPQQETGNVTLPESFKKSYKAYVDGDGALMHQLIWVE